MDIIDQGYCTTKYGTRDVPDQANIKFAYAERDLLSPVSRPLLPCFPIEALNVWESSCDGVPVICVIQNFVSSFDDLKALKGPVTTCRMIQVGFLDLRCSDSPRLNVKSITHHKQPPNRLRADISITAVKG